VVVVRMADEHPVQPQARVVGRHRRRHRAARAEEGQRRRVVLEDGVGDEGQPLEREQHARVAGPERGRAAGRVGGKRGVVRGVQRESRAAGLRRGGEGAAVSACTKGGRAFAPSALLKASRSGQAAPPAAGGPGPRHPRSPRAARTACLRASAWGCRRGGPSAARRARASGGRTPTPRAGSCRPATCLGNGAAGTGVSQALLVGSSTWVRAPPPPARSRHRPPRAPQGSANRPPMRGAGAAPAARPVMIGPAARTAAPAGENGRGG
jgi:hypothetical protein